MRDIFLTVFLFALLPVCFIRPWIGILVWYWLSIMQPHRLTWGFAAQMPFAALIAGSILAGIFFCRDRKPIPWNPGVIIICFLIFYFMITNELAWVPSSAWESWDKVFKITLTSILTTMLIYGKDRVRLLIIVSALSIAFYGVKGGIFSLLTGGVYRVWAPDGSMLQGNNFLGLGLVMTIPVLIAIGRTESHIWIKRAFFVAAGLSIIAAVFTYSRGALVGLAATALWMMMSLKRKRLLAISALAVIAIGIYSFAPEALFKRTSTIENFQQDMAANQRFQSWIVAVNVALERPLTGAGFAFYDYPDGGLRWLSYGSPDFYWALQNPSAAHSAYFQVIGEQGLLVFALYMIMLVYSIVSLKRMARITLSHSGSSWIGEYANGIQTGLIGFMVSGAFLSVAFFDLMYLYIVITAILEREIQIEGLSNRPVPK